MEVYDDSIIKKLTNICTFASNKAVILNGSIRYLPKTNIAYIEPSRLITKDGKYMIFGNNNINCICNKTLHNKLSLKELENNIRRDAIK